MNKYSEWLKATRSKVKENLNIYLKQEGLMTIKHFLSSSIGLEDKPLSIAVYPTSSGEASYTESEAGEISCRFTIAFYQNEDATEESMELIERYFEAITSFISNQTFGEESIIERADIIRMDDMEPVNGAVFLIKSRITSFADYGWI